MKSGLSKLAHRAALGIEWGLDEVVHGVKKVVGGRDPLVVVPYRGFGDGETAHLRARVLEERGIDKPEKNASRWQNLLYMLDRYASNEIREARVRVSWEGGEREATTDDDGFIEVDLPLEKKVPETPEGRWAEVTLELLEPLRHQDRVEVTGHVLVPPRSARFGVISDVDDTIIRTGANALMRSWRTQLLSNAATRTAFAGLPQFYRGLAAGQGGEGNPIFYVSSSPWNLYDLFERYLELHDIPLGPFLLKDFGLDRDKWFTGSHDAHKLRSIDRVLSTYPHLPFVLVGDSGQRDTEIYSKVVQQYPGRIQAVYIRDVTGDERDAEAKEVLDAIENAGVDVAYGEDLVEAAEHACSHGWVTGATLDAVRDAVARRQ